MDSNKEFQTFWYQSDETIYYGCDDLYKVSKEYYDEKFEKKTFWYQKLTRKEITNGVIYYGCGYNGTEKEVLNVYYKISKEYYYECKEKNPIGSFINKYNCNDYLLTWEYTSATNYSSMLRYCNYNVINDSNLYNDNKETIYFIRREYIHKNNIVKSI
jgi:hypothetical protein